jgi:GGDEF domain-containing protein
MLLGGLCLRIATSVGIAHFPEDGTTGEGLLRLADQAMYRDKHRPKDGSAIDDHLGPNYT